MTKKIDKYLEVIRQGSKGVEPSERTRVENELEVLALRLTFDGKIARLVRIKDDKSVSDLADQVGCTYMAINHYEKGRKVPPLTTKFGRGYLAYLASKRYDPIEGIIPSMRS